MPRGHRDLRGKAVLVVEDEFMIAMDYAMYLEAMGATVVGPVSSVPQALAMLREQPIDAAVLDIDLQGTKAFMVADALMERRIGFVFASGYDDIVIPERFSGVIRCGSRQRLPTWPMRCVAFVPNDLALTSTHLFQSKN